MSTAASPGVTFEDLVEELVGDVVDEYDSPARASGATRRPDGYCPGCFDLMRSKPPSVSNCLPDVPTTRRWPGSFSSGCADPGPRRPGRRARRHTDRGTNGRPPDSIGIESFCLRTIPTALRRRPASPIRRPGGSIVTAASLCSRLPSCGERVLVGAEFSSSRAAAPVEPLLRGSARLGPHCKRSAVAPDDLDLQFGITLALPRSGRARGTRHASLLTETLGSPSCPAWVIHPLALVIALRVVSWLHMLLGEMVPKNLALTGPERAAIMLTPALMVFVRMFDHDHHRPDSSGNQCFETAGHQTRK